MKILFLADDFPPQAFGGAGISTYELAKEMHKLGHQVFVITTCRKREDGGEMELEGLHLFRIFASYHERWRAYLSLYNPQTVAKVRQILELIKPDIVHANNIHLNLSYYCLKLAKKYARCVIWTARDVMAVSDGKLTTKRYLEYLNPKIYWYENLALAKKRWNPFRNFVIKKILDSTDQKIAISRALQQILEANGINNVKVIYNGINLDDWNSDPLKIEAFKVRHGLREKKVVLYSGRLSLEKGSEQALSAISIVSRAIPNAVLLVAGTGELKSRDNVIFTGWIDRDEMQLAYGSADVVWMPSISFDAFGRVNIEAMAASKPVIGTCFGGTPEIVEDGKTGYIVDPRHAEKIAEKTIDLLKNPQKALEFGKAGYERVKRLFNLKDKAQEYISLYNAIISQNGRENG